MTLFVWVLYSSGFWVAVVFEGEGLGAGGGSHSSSVTVKAADDALCPACLGTFAPALQYDKGLRILLRDPFECRTNPEATEHWPDERSSSLLPHPVGIWHECSTRLLP